MKLHTFTFFSLKDSEQNSLIKQVWSVQWFFGNPDPEWSIQLWTNYTFSVFSTARATAVHYYYYHHHHILLGTVLSLQ